MQNTHLVINSSYVLIRFFANYHVYKQFITLHEFCVSAEKFMALCLRIVVNQANGTKLLLNSPPEYCTYTLAYLKMNLD